MHSFFYKRYKYIKKLRKRLYAYNLFCDFLFKVGLSVEWDDVEILSFLPSKNIFVVHVHVHRPQNRIKIEEGQQPDFSRENAQGT